MGLRWRFAIAITVFVLSLVYAMPSLPYLGTALERVLPESRINLGLDLKGGIHMTLGVDVAKAVSNSLALTGQDLRRMAQDEKIVILRPRVVGGTALEFVLPRAENEKQLRELLARYFSQLSVGAPQAGESGQLRYVASFTEAEIQRLETLALDQALRTIRNRIDQFGVAEPDIRKQEGNRIQLQLPGISDSERAVQIIGQTAHLEFHLVRDDVDPGKAVLPPGVVSLPLLEKSGGEQKESRIAVEKDAMLTGEDVVDARPAFDQMNQAYVTLTFNARGARIFERVTGENVGRRMAIVLDGKVYSAPSIRERIGGGRASISGSFTTAEAQDLAIVLRAGSLPAPVSVLEERTVGPSLGQEAIDSGIRAALVGAALVVLFIGVYYGMSGIIANLMLCFTMLIVMAGMGAFGATLTLPGIAGIVLTIGMAVDANVLIYERIREELRLGLTPLAAVRAGFERAAVSITDSNLTTIIVAVILYQFGTGPVRGFAVTLALGIIASMFTAIFVSRAIFEHWARRCGPRGISI
ncbi:MULTISPECIES: protein translocase subunit SecD [unclassified Desulfovibrio]|uniref:protein translocase subunit SecD n=1 Tax=unclassified Desulfovibrio TaxID=2593640 RepID=UPI000F5F3431|nr:MULTISPECIES: protein translocase subunit SecD [unclassified Desulfovibrio]RRD69488.1 protein translocase subunit SecD [Desulfovibrio sp. OH1209_COT-279]RRD86167.1 protein translocase subunit SecD [Desulfovibrio sp. OH1186_COT-070]